MAVRLPVIVSQAEARDRRSADIEESLVAELIMSGGLDATLVGPLRRIALDSTDLICLRGFSHDLALLSWMTIDEVELAWQALGMTGAFIDMQPVAERPATPARQQSRRIYYLQLRSDSDPKILCATLRAKLEDMRIKPVSIQLLKPIGSGAAKPPARVDVAPTAASILPTPSNAVPAEHSDQSPNNEPQWDQLDQLVDDLDALNL
jgi:hypothetical protein